MTYIIVSQSKEFLLSDQMALKKGKNIVKKAKIGTIAYFRIFIVLDYRLSFKKTFNILLCSTLLNIVFIFI